MTNYATATAFVQNSLAIAHQIVNDQGEPTAEFWALIEAHNEILKGVVSFAQGDGEDFAISADNITQGIKNQIEIIGSRVFGYLGEDVISVDKYDPDDFEYDTINNILLSGTLLENRVFDYDGEDVSQATITDVINNIVSIQDYFYAGESIAAVGVNVAIGF